MLTVMPFSTFSILLVAVKVIQINVHMSMCLAFLTWFIVVFYLFGEQDNGDNLSEYREKRRSRKNRIHGQVMYT